MLKKYVCIRGCYQVDENRRPHNFSVGDTTWRDNDPGMYWREVTDEKEPEKKET